MQTAAVLFPENTYIFINRDNQCLAGHSCYMYDYYHSTMIVNINKTNISW